MPRSRFRAPQPTREELLRRMHHLYTEITSHLHVCQSAMKNKILMNVETCTELQELINRAKSLQERSELNLDVGEVEQQHEATGFEEMVENLEAVELLDIITTQLREATEELQSLRESLLEGKKDRSHSNWEQRMFERRKARLRAIEKATRRQELLSKSECHDEPGPSGCTCYIVDNGRHIDDGHTPYMILEN